MGKDHRDAGFLHFLALWMRHTLENIVYFSLFVQMAYIITNKPVENLLSFLKHWIFWGLIVTLAWLADLFQVNMRGPSPWTGFTFGLEFDGFGHMTVQSTPLAIFFFSFLMAFVITLIYVTYAACGDLILNLIWGNEEGSTKKAWQTLGFVCVASVLMGFFSAFTTI